MNKSFQEYAKKVKKVSGSRNHKIKNSLGMKDAYFYYRKNRPSDNKYALTERQYSSIINEMNYLWTEELINKGKMMFPEGLGGAHIVKNDVSPIIDKNGNLKIRRNVNPSATLKLWFEDDEARQNKTLVRFESDESFKIVYWMSKAKFKNYPYVRIQFTRALKKRLHERIMSGGYDTFENSKKWEI